jgi:uncharacterized linocin/CFP29 family protein
MNHLFRELAPISERAWEQIDAEASRSLRNFLAARKLVDFSGPHGWEHSAVSLGRVDDLASPPGEGVTAAVRRVQPLIELRTPFTLRREELYAIDRGSEAPDLQPVVVAARQAAHAEDRAVFHGYGAGGVAGIAEASPHAAIPIDPDYEEFPRSVSRAVATLRAAGVDGPYGIALGPRCYEGVIETTQKGGYPVLEQVRLIASGPLVWAPAVDGAIVLSLRSGDFELTTGEDFAIGYVSSDAQTVDLALEESMTFRAHTPEAAVALVHTS